MGYWVDIEVSNVTIAKDKVEDCLAAINAMHEPDTMKGKAGGGSSDGGIWYSWVDNPPEGGFKSLVDAFKAWRYEATEDAVGNVVLHCFTGSKWGDDEYLYQTLAPFVNSDGMIGEIACRGEDGLLWRYTFDNGSMVEETGTVMWS